MCKHQQVPAKYLLLFMMSFMFSGCAHQATPGFDDDYSSSSNLPTYRGQAPYSSSFNEGSYTSMLPGSYPTNGEKLVLVDPNIHAWGAYDENGNLVRGGIATAGADFCSDIGRPCHTRSGSFRIYSLGNADCVSKSYPVGEGGALMPYCMFFNGGESLHGSPDQMMVPQNISHGCVHLRIPDAEWIRYNFASQGTRVVVKPY
ncbi:MAG: L,D-transpeptidase [Gammaproteobacteria bacterium]|nr:L,D-transpeptidase [Gammaproteobacteria bacterium]